MGKKGGGTKKEIILENAKAMFSQKGYDATSMDEVAAKTNVPKSLIYYHFKSKEELLQSVIEQFLTEYKNLLSKSTKDEISYMDFLNRNSDFLRIIITESMKKDSTFSSMFKVVEHLMIFESNITKDKNLEIYAQSHERWVAEFFTSIIPCVLFSCYKEKWAEYFNTDLSILEKDFSVVYDKTHGAYHKSLEADKT